MDEAAGQFAPGIVDRPVGGQPLSSATADASAALDRLESASPSFSRRTVRLTLARVGPRLGLIWIALVSLLAILSPLLASSHPLLMKAAGHWSSPWLTYLTATDIALFVFAISVSAALIFRRIPFIARFWLVIGLTLFAGVVAGTFKRIPEPVLYDQYRRAAARGELEYVLYTPIPYSPNDQLFEQERMQTLAPGRAHLMGTTAYSTDVAANMLFATRIALSIGFVATGVAVVLGIIMGGLMGYFGGWIDLIGMRIVEVFESIPTLLLLLAFVQLFQDAGSWTLYYLMGIIGFMSSFGYAEFVRAEYLTLRDRDFVHAARAAGLPLSSILFRHILPNGLTPVIVNISFGIAGAILIESTLSFLGIGLKDDTSWGRLLQQAQGETGLFYWWLALFPGGAIFLTVFSYNLIGEALQDALDPKIVQST